MWTQKLCSLEIFIPGSESFPKVISLISSPNRLLNNEIGRKSNEKIVSPGHSVSPALASQEWRASYAVGIIWRKKGDSIAWKTYDVDVLYTWSWIYIISENLQHTKYSGGFGGVFCCCQATSVTAEKLSWTRILNERNANERASFPATLFAPKTAKYDAIWAGEPFERGGEEMGAILGLLCNFWGRFVGFVSGKYKIDRVTNDRQI